MTTTAQKNKVDVLTDIQAVVLEKLQQVFSTDITAENIKHAEEVGGLAVSTIGGSSSYERTPSPTRSVRITPVEKK